MKSYHIFFAILKIATLVQFALILMNKQSVDSKIYIITKIIFKISIGIFIDILMFHQKIDGLLLEDKVVISFAGALLIFDACANDIPDLLRLYGIHVFDSTKTKSLIHA
jgi:hypothetical protein